ncbi:hypothetical protein H8356DRAFT_965062 [Neocallimastix lanati (nom. inval.)]|uniref:Uncharacterized protein n=1 Tax=Neocallimastix californiae TaxID=1754190 RepID=A0A1Y2CTG3_9FUNG|nr:hypothetical protein H8356DRAFT_965062 [Neocallimastix sp. JGI-2020a]ORY49645.1 hypothetical protein LY90DRAFT_670821 [Neocallimastix californiae]|eukprot:ORY49645.1 hypothetical protein LY90DRAFT_670821 [Neocallimastix californiae]
MNDPQSEYMKDYYKKMIETENLKRYIRSKKKEKNKLNIEILHMYDSDIEKIRNANNLERVTYETNYKVAGPHYVGADKQLYELCRKRNLITLPKKYIEYQKYLEDSLEKENKITPTVKDIIKDENKENEVKPINEEKKNVPNITKGPRFKKSRKEFKSFENNYIIDEKTLDLKYNSNNSVQKFSYLKPKRKSAPIQTYLGSNSGYNALCQPAIDKCLIQRHNTHRNKEKFNIEQTVLRRLRYILGHQDIDKNHLDLIDTLREAKIPNDIIKYIFQENFDTLKQLRIEFLNELLDDNEDECIIRNKNETNKPKTMNNWDIEDKDSKNYESDTNIEDNENTELSENSEDMENNYNEKKILSKSNIHNIINIDLKKINKRFSSSTDKVKFNEETIHYPKIKYKSEKMRIIPNKKEPTTPKELLYIIDNYKNLNMKIQNDYNRYKRANPNSSSYSTLNFGRSEKNLKLKSKLNNRTLSFHEILNALHE